MRKILALLFALPLLLSCESVLFEEDKMSTDPLTNFNYLWNECNTKYSYFELKHVNWDSIKTVYKAKVSSGISDDSLFQVMGDMLRELKDDHTNLISDFNISYFGVQYYGQDNFDWRIIEDHYITHDYYISGPFAHNFIANKQIGYVRFSAFTGTVDENNLNFVLNRYKDTKGLILDLRENGGGAATDIFSLLGHFIDKKTLVYYSRVKTGPGHNDFGAPEPAYATPSKGTLYTKKVMVLVDRGTFSAGSFTALATKAIPNMVLVGDTTGGGLGLPNGGQLPNGWIYRFSISQALTLDKKPDYERGVPPDIAVLFNWSDLTKDAIIDRAIDEIIL